jgi:hypothetical protein
VRRRAYAKNNGCCWACGEWGRLEAHESYEIHYYAGLLVLKEIVALCKSCHEFIHSGRLKLLWRDGQLNRSYVEEVMRSRMKMVDDAGLEPFYGTLAFFYELTENTSFDIALIRVYREGKAHISMAPYTPRPEWLLIVDSQIYDYGGLVHDCSE